MSHSNRRNLLFPDQTPTVIPGSYQWVPGSCLIEFVDGLSFTERLRLEDPTLRRADDLEVLMQRVRKYEYEIQVLIDAIKMNNDAHACKRLRLEKDALDDFKTRWNLQ